MRPYFIVVTPPLLDHDLRLDARSEPFQTQAFVPEFTVEALLSTVLPWLAGVAERHVHAVLCCPALDRAGHKLRPVVGTQITRRTVEADQL